MKRSAEIEQLSRALIDALERGDIGFIEGATSREPGSVAIGTDPNEYSREYDEIIKLMRESAPDAGMRIHVRLAEIRGYEHGDVAWADGTGAFERDGQSVETRFTLVFVREKGEWRVVQNHASIGVPNEKMFEPIFRPAQTMRRS